MSKTIFCNLCKTSKQLSEFYKSPNGKPRAGCKACRRADSRKRDPGYYQKNPVGCKAKVVRWQKRNPDRARQYARTGMKRMRRQRREAGTPELPLNLPPPPARRSQATARPDFDKP